MHEWEQLKQLLPYCILVGLAAAYLAKTKKGRRPFVWFLIGFSFGILGLVTLFFLPKHKEQTEELPPVPPIKISHVKKGDWYFINQTEQQEGPISYEELQTKALDEETYVWHEQFSEWKKLKEISI